MSKVIDPTHFMVFPLYAMRRTSGSGVTMALIGVCGNICRYVLIGSVLAPEPVSIFTLIGPVTGGAVLEMIND